MNPNGVWQGCGLIPKELIQQANSHIILAPIWQICAKQKPLSKAMQS